MPRNSCRSTLVVGGGLAGLATAAALRNIANIDAVHVVESMCDTLTNESAGAAMQLGPNAFKALEVIGGTELIDKIYEAGSILEETLILLPGGAPPASIPFTAKAETGYPIILIRWGVLRKLLGELLPEDSISFGTGSDIVGYSFLNDDNDKDNNNTDVDVDVDVESVDKEGKKICVGSLSSSQLIVGADGLNSVFRERVQTKTTIPEKDCEPVSSTFSLKDNKRVNIKAVVPMELKDLGNVNSIFSKEGAAFAQFDQQVANFAGPAGKGYTYWAVSVADDKESGSKFLSTELMNDKGASKKMLLEKLEASSSSSDREWIISLVERTDPSTILINRSQEASVKEQDSFVSNDGRVVLVGDAAHAMNPAYGQSASFAFEDAATLALLLKGKQNNNNDNDNNSNDVAEALQEYSDNRVRRCMEMQRRSQERATKSMRGDKNATEDVSKWIYAWEP